MRFPVAYYLMLIYLTVIFKPVIPVLSDGYAHVFGEAIHLATVHAKYGSHHLGKDMAKNDESNNQKNTNTDQSYQVHVNTTDCLYNFTFDGVVLSCHLSRSYKLSEIFLSRVIPPPKC